MSGINVFVTDFSDVRIGPEWTAFIKEHTSGLSADKRTKRYKYAKQKLREIEQAISIMAEFEWWHDGILEELP